MNALVEVSMFELRVAERLEQRARSTTRVMDKLEKRHGVGRARLWAEHHEQRSKLRKRQSKKTVNGLTEELIDTRARLRLKQYDDMMRLHERQREEALILAEVGDVLLTFDRNL
jgi:hypothetical protein